MSAFVCYLFLFICGFKPSLASILQNHTEVTQCHSQMTPLCHQYYALPINFSSFHLFTFKFLTTKFQHMSGFLFFPFSPALLPQNGHIYLLSNQYYVDTITFCYNFVQRSLVFRPQLHIGTLTVKLCLLNINPKLSFFETISVYIALS